MGKYVASQTFNASGTWTCPPGVTLALVVGYGGGGGASSTGGGGGSRLQSQLVQVVPGTSYTVTIGAGGTTDGGNTTFGGLATFVGGKGSTTGTGGADGVQTDGDPNSPQAGGTVSGSFGGPGMSGPVNAYTGGSAVSTNSGGGAGGGGNGANGGSDATANTGAGAGGGAHTGGSGQLTVYWWPGMASQTFSANGTWQAPSSYAGPVLCIGKGGTTTSITQYSIFKAVSGQSYTIAAGSGVNTTVKLGSAQVFGAYAMTGGSNAGGSVTLYWWPTPAAVQTFNASGTWTAPPGYADPVLLYGFGGGGGGGAGYNGNAGGGGSTSQFIAVFPTPGQSYAVTVGAGGGGGAAATTQSGSNGVPGGATSFGSLASFMGGQAGMGWNSSYNIYPGAADTAHALGSPVGTGGTDTSFMQPGWGGSGIYNAGNTYGPTPFPFSWQCYAAGTNGTTFLHVAGGAGGGGPNGVGGNGGNGNNAPTNETPGTAASANTGAGGGAGGGGTAGVAPGASGGSGQLVVAWFP